MHPSPPSPHHLAKTASRCERLREHVADRLRGRSKITLEIGSGHGHYLTGYAAQHPDRVCVGIDIIMDRWERSERKRDRAALENLMFFRAEATEFLAALPADILLADVFILFPDPWPKRRHHKNRIMRPGFLRELALRSLPGAHLFFRTDHTEYFQAALDALADVPEWQPAPGAVWSFELPTVFQSRAETYQSMIARRSG